MADTHEPRSARERRAFARMGLLAVIVAAAAMTLAAVVILSHRPHTPELTPGQRQREALVAGE